MLYRRNSFIVASYVNMKDEKITSLLRRVDNSEDYEDVVNDKVIDMYDIFSGTIKNLADLIEIKENRISKQDALKCYIKYFNSTKTKKENRELGE